MKYAQNTLTIFPSCLLEFIQTFLFHQDKFVIFQGIKPCTLFIPHQATFLQPF